MSKRPVFCVAASHPQADRIVGQLKAANFSQNDISLLFPDKDAMHVSDHVLLAVHTANSDEISRVKTIFTDGGAGDICTSGEAAFSDTPTRDPSTHSAVSSVRYPSSD